ncbi:MAG TPA: hypothetical protein VIC04_00460 [Terriglobia bacterium]
MISDLQRIHIKILSNAPAGLNQEPFIEIFARWRTERNHPAEWVDLADYAHVPRGPGIVLVGQRANFAFDMADPAPGILYAAKKGLTGSHIERMTAAMKSCLELAKRLIAEPEFPKGVALRTDALELRFADRLVTPNTPATDQELRPVVRQAMDRLFGPTGYELTAPADAGETYGFSIRAKKAEPLDALLQRIR